MMIILDTIGTRGIYTDTKCKQEYKNVVGIWHQSLNTTILAALRKNTCQSMVL